jgi:hypothetical protein
MSSRGPLFAAVLIALVGGLVAIAGCGGGSATATVDSHPTKVVFVRKADAICKAAVQKIVVHSVPIVKRGPEPGESRYQMELKIVNSLLIPTLEDEIGKLQALGSPRGEEAKFTGFLRGMNEALEEARKKPQTYITAGGHYVYGRIHYATATKFAKSLGLTQCPQGDEGAS